MVGLKREQKTVVVLGMHRSGTSAVAGVLQILGVDMGDKMVTKDQFNTRGYFEDLEFQVLNKQILENTGARWDSPPDKDTLEGVADFSPAIKELTAKGKPIWGWKDPRTVLTIELYLPYLVNPHLVICFRNPYGIARSLKERDGSDTLKSLRLTNTYNERILNFFESHPDLPKIFIAFEDVLANPIAQAGRLARFLDLELTEEKVEQIRKFVGPTGEIQQEKVKMQREVERRLKKDLQGLQQHLRDIYNSRGWKIISFLHCVRMKIPILKSL